VRSGWCAVAIALVGCSGSPGHAQQDVDSGSLPPDGGSAQDAPSDPPDGGGGGHPVDAGADVGVYDFPCGGSGPACPLTEACCATPGTPTTFACVAPASCPAKNTIACWGPGDCGGSTPVCCGVATTSGTGTYPNCNPGSLESSCTAAATCPTHLGSSCTDTTKVVLCHAKSDCADAQNPECCTFASATTQLTICIDKLTAAAGGGQCH
jgi:hypothetical protein